MDATLARPRSHPLLSVLWCCPSPSAQGPGRLPICVLHPWRFLGPVIPLHGVPFALRFLKGIGFCCHLALPIALCIGGFQERLTIGCLGYNVLDGAFIVSFKMLSLNSNNS